MGITVNCEYPTPHQRDYKQPRDRKKKKITEHKSEENALDIYQ